MYIGVDIGGTNALAILLKDGKVIHKIKKKTPTKDWGSFIVTLVDEINKDNQALGIGLALAGALDQQRCALKASPNLKGIVGCNFKELLIGEFGIDVSLGNDANCFTFAEALRGAGKNYRNVLGLTLGTGLGSGLVIKGEIFRGGFGTAPEAGHMIVKAGGAKCGCGAKGCLEQYASSQFFFQQFSQNPLTTFKKAKEKDPQALKAWQYFGYWLGLGIGNLVNLFEPNIVVLGGEMTNAWDFFIKDVQKSAQEHIFSPTAKENIKIVRSELGYLAGAIGAATLVEAESKYY